MEHVETTITQEVYLPFLKCLFLAELVWVRQRQSRGHCFCYSLCAGAFYFPVRAPYLDFFDVDLASYLHDMALVVGSVDVKYHEDFAMAFPWRVEQLGLYS